MGVYEVRWKNSAVKELRKFESSARVRIADAVGKLSDEPHPNGCKKLRGSLCTYRIRIGEFRVVYEVESHSKRIIIVRVRHRREVYK